MEAAWAQGITGRNVTTAIMDDGVDYMHPDLRERFVSTSRGLGVSPLEMPRVAASLTL